MALKTGRAHGPATVVIDPEKCIHCGLCVTVCKGAPLYLDQGKVKVDQSIMFGCIACGQCVAVCPQNCIIIDGRDLSAGDIIDLPAPDLTATYDQLLHLMTGRRSVRNFTDRQVEPEVIDRILQAATTAPMGIPPSDVEILVLNGKMKVREFSEDMIELMKSWKWMFSPLARWVWRPFIGKEAFETLTAFILPVIRIFEEKKKHGEDWLLYDAPLAMYFHASAYSDPYDPIIAATYAMLAAESSGIGACFIGTPAHFIKYSRKLKNKYHIPLTNQQGIMVIFGYPAVQYRRAIRRRLANVHYF